MDLLIIDKRTRDRVVEALVQRLPTAGSFKHANNLASRLQQQNPSLSADQIKRLMRAREENDQVGGAYIANPYIEELGKSIEPVREDYGPDEAPF